MLRRTMAIIVVLAILPGFIACDFSSGSRARWGGSVTAWTAIAAGSCFLYGSYFFETAMVLPSFLLLSRLKLRHENRADREQFPNQAQLLWEQVRSSLVIASVLTVLDLSSRGSGKNKMEVPQMDFQQGDQLRMTICALGGTIAVLTLIQLIMVLRFARA